MLIKTKHPQHGNIKLNLPIVGEVDIKDGIVDVPKEVHDMMIGDGKNEWSSAEAEAQKNEQEVESTDEFEVQINSLSFEEVKTLASEANIPNWEKFAKKEKALRSYVIKKLREAQTAVELEEIQKQLDEDSKEDTGSPLDQEDQENV